MYWWDVGHGWRGAGGLLLPWPVQGWTCHVGHGEVQWGKGKHGRPVLSERKHRHQVNTTPPRGHASQRAAQQAGIGTIVRARKEGIWQVKWIGINYSDSVLTCCTYTAGIILGMGSANKRWCYIELSPYWEWSLYRPVFYLWLRKFSANDIRCYKCNSHWLRTTLIEKFMGPTWGPSGADRTQVGPMLAPWTLLSGLFNHRLRWALIWNIPTVDSDSDSDRGLFNIKLHTKVLHQVYIAKQYEHIEQIWTWHNQKYLLGDLY